MFFINENGKKVVDNKKVFGALLTDVSKAFDSISHDFKVTRIRIRIVYAYGLPFPALKLMQDYLQNHKQRAKIGTAYSNWQDILAGVPQGSIVGSILFNIFLCDAFLDQGNNYLTNYATQMIQCLT